MPEQSCHCSGTTGINDGHAWESELAKLLGRLSDAQQQLLGTAGPQTRNADQARPRGALGTCCPRKRNLCAELQACHDRRQQLLEQAAAEGMPADSIRSLAASLPRGESQSLKQSLDEANQRSRLLATSLRGPMGRRAANHAASFPHGRDYCYWRAIKADIWKGGRGYQ